MRAKDMTAELARQLIEKHGNGRNAVKAILPRCIGRNGEPATLNAVEKWISNALIGQAPRTIIDKAEADKLNQIKNALDEANIPVEAIGRIDHVRVRSGYHEGLTKGPEGEPVVTHLRSKHVSIMLSPKWAEGPEWPVIEPAKPVKVTNPTPKKKSTDLKTVVVISDVQVGFLRDIEDPTNLVPMHDRAAIDVALQIVADLRPQQLVYVGDFLDLPEMSRYVQHAEFAMTTQAAVDEGYKILAKFEAAAGPREQRDPTTFLGGNHEARIRSYILANARAAFNLRPAQETPNSWPDLSVPHLLRFEELGIAYAGEYPGGEFWLNPGLVIRHDPQSKEAYDASVIAGHTHHVRREDFTRRTPTGDKKHTLWEIGCLCSLDNYGDKRSLLATKVPSNRAFHKNWSHSFAVVTLMPDETFSVELVEYIKPSKAVFRGKPYESKKEL